MSKITNDCLTRSCTGCFIAVPLWQQWTSKVNAAFYDERDVREGSETLAGKCRRTEA